MSVLKQTENAGDYKQKCGQSFIKNTIFAAAARTVVSQFTRTKKERFLNVRLGSKYDSWMKLL